uniref:Uncharacterized protein n=1 Tax=Mesocestoides corti TaxID=53468 RepID=A0A5K3G5P4_MESCO
MLSCCCRCEHSPRRNIASSSPPPPPPPLNPLHSRLSRPSCVTTSSDLANPAALASRWLCGDFTSISGIPHITAASAEPRAPASRWPAAAPTSFFPSSSSSPSPSPYNQNTCSCQTQTSHREYANSSTPLPPPPQKTTHTDHSTQKLLPLL